LTQAESEELYGAAPKSLSSSEAAE
jgi:hypothetical protein